MKFTVVGCSGSVPGPDSPASSYLVESQGRQVVLDLGPGAFGALLRHTAPERLDAVVISHLHADHFFDLAALATYLKHSRAALDRPLTIVAPSAARERLALAYAGTLRFDSSDVFDFVAVDDWADREVGPFAATFARTRHPIETYAIRLEAEGKSLTYSADTGPSDAVVALARGTDVFVCEAAFDDDDPFVPDLHLTGAQAGEHATRAETARLLITHVPPWHSRDRIAASAATTYDGPLHAVLADDVIEL